MGDERTMGAVVINLIANTCSRRHGLCMRVCFCTRVVLLVCMKSGKFDHCTQQLKGVGNVKQVAPLQAKPAMGTEVITWAA